jgi:hypothetical protein
MSNIQSSLRRWILHMPKSRSRSANVPRVSPPRVPEELQTGPPDFVGIGAQKSGTTWWHSLLAKHPRVFQPDYMKSLVSPASLAKERHFFDRFFVDEFLDSHVADYHAWFPRPEGTIACEWTPRYLVDHWVPALMKRAAPQTKLLVMLRDPVERYISGFSHTRRTIKDPPARVAVEHCARGLYDQQLTQWLKHFSRESILVLQYERCVENPEKMLSNTFSFLGLDPQQYQFVTDQLAQKVLATKPGAQVALHDRHREALVERLADDVVRLADHFSEIDLALWPNFRHLQS